MHGIWRRNHRRLWYGIVGALAVFMALLVILIDRRSTPAPLPSSTKAPFQVIGFYQNPAPRSSEPTSMSSFSTHWPKMTTVSPLWFAVAPRGRVVNTGYAKSLVNMAHLHHRLVVPLFVNAKGSTAVLWRASTRHLATANIKAAVKKYHLDGINLDFELLKPTSRADFSKFVADVHTALQPLNKVVAVSVFPLVGVPRSVNGADDYAALSKSANYLVVMAYDHHYSGGPPGPVAPYPWVRANVTRALTLAPAHKLVLAIGMYGYDWINNGKPGPAQTVPDVAARQLAKAHGVTPRFDRANSQNTFTYHAAGVSHVVWYMGDRSAKVRVNLAKKERLGGVALWHLGDENARFWRDIPSRS